MHQQYPQKEVCYMKWDWDSQYCFFKGWCLYFTKLKPKRCDKGISAMIKGCTLYHLGALLARYGPGEINDRRPYPSPFVKSDGRCCGRFQEVEKIMLWIRQTGIIGRCCYMICIKIYNVTAFAHILIQSVQQGSCCHAGSWDVPQARFQSFSGPTFRHSTCRWVQETVTPGPYKNMFGIRESLITCCTFRIVQDMISMILGEFTQMCVACIHIFCLLILSGSIRRNWHKPTRHDRTWQMTSFQQWRAPWVQRRFAWRRGIKKLCACLFAYSWKVSKTLVICCMEGIDTTQLYRD